MLQLKNFKSSFSVFYLLVLTASLVLSGCDKPVIKQQKLPVLGPWKLTQNPNKKNAGSDTLFAQIPDFKFVNQDSLPVTNQTFAGKIYVADFFFTSCPTICPKMKTQLLRVYQQFKDSSQVMILSHTIDPTHDSVAVLNEYAEVLGVNTAKWQFVTGEKDSIYSVAQKYLVSPIKEGAESGSAVHSGAFVLVDKQRHVRGIYDGTDQTQVDKLLRDIPVLLQEESKIN